MKQVFPQVAFLVLCLIYGGSYAFVAKALPYYDGSLLNSLRMWFAFLGAIIILAIQTTLIPGFHANIRKSIKSGNTPILSAMFCGIINYGFPHSLITLAQRSLPSVVIIIAQPFVSLFAFIMASYIIPDERFSWRRFVPQLIAITGSVLTSLPSISNSSDSNQSSPFAFILLLIALLSFGYGSVYIKAYLSHANPTMLSVSQLLGSALYSTLFSFYRIGFSGYFTQISEAGGSSIIWPIILGVVFTCSSSFLFVYVVRELGSMIAGLANFGQIVVGVFIGIIFLDEWKEYTTLHMIESYIGLAILALSIYLGFKAENDSKTEPKSLLDP